jgi:hypothetical protein
MIFFKRKKDYIQRLKGDFFKEYYIVVERKKQQNKKFFFQQFLLIFAVLRKIILKTFSWFFVRKPLGITK